GDETVSMPLNAELESGCETFGARGTTSTDREVELMTLSPDGRSLAFSQGSDCVVVRDLQTLKTQAILHGNTSGFLFRPDGLLTVVSTPRYVAPPQRPPGPDQTTVRIWDWRHRVIRKTLPVPVVGSNTFTGFWRFAMSADGQRIALFDTTRHRVFLWNGDL